MADGSVDQIASNMRERATRATVYTALHTDTADHKERTTVIQRFLDRVL